MNMYSTLFGSSRSVDRLGTRRLWGTTVREQILGEACRKQELGDGGGSNTDDIRL